MYYGNSLTTSGALQPNVTFYTASPHVWCITIYWNRTRRYKYFSYFF